jgi:AraC-like DNA-binding protein
MPTPRIVDLARNAQDGVRVFRREGKPVVHLPHLHGHRFFVLLYLDGGAGELRFPGCSTKVSTGHVHFIAPGELHDTSGLATARGWVVEFTPEALGARIASPGSLVLPRSGPAHQGAFRRRPGGKPFHALLPPDRRALWSLRMRTLTRELTERRVGYRDAVQCMLQLFLIDLARLLSEEERISVTEPVLDAVFEVLEARYAEDLSLPQVARSVGRSPAHLTTTLKRQTGLSMVQWLTERRLAEARWLLLSTDEPVGLIADRVGYHDVTHFTRLFRRAHELTPRDWRKRARATGEGEERQKAPTERKAESEPRPQARKG